MRTARIQIFLVGLMIVAGFGCGKKLFQSRLTEKPTSITQYEWRLIETNDSDFKSWNFCYDFIVSKFTTQFQGLLKQAKGNVIQEDDKASKFLYYVDPGAGLLCVDYRLASSRAQPKTVAELAALCKNGSSDVSRYRYELSRDGLTLYELTAGGGYGRYYHYVDFRGALNPDQACNL